ncbi:UDP-N-acetylglucosamine transferase subunit ALG13 [Geomicrobium halophilum]|uniref:UDP-N-acetylglucosamine transferase subunit ALG13 n=1 Tax=Geomicrobium halophilum TaxID=549000 RepID=A0A841PZU2_9BACL|nr:glycosyltransferase [Geomicrobium halophilum]MBB6450392.1 UDP-N-acetylglucosamine transferase subunit ALG13 [Geomicrobium halophilum]
MILVVVGTQELPFTRLLQEVEDLVKTGSIQEKVLVQNGHTPVEHFSYLDCTPFFSYEKMDELYDQARVIISHGGTGSLITGIKKGKPVIASARLSKYGEHNDDHQEEIIAQFVETKHILSSGDLAKDLDSVNEGFLPAPFESGRKKILNKLRSFIEDS